MRTSSTAAGSVLYGVCGIGLGHARRSIEIISSLPAGRRVCVASGDGAYGFLRKEANGSAVLTDEIDVIKIYPGSNTSYDFFRTARKSLPKIPEVFYRNWKIFDKSAADADAVISDHEISSLLWGKAKGKKTVSVSHVHGMYFSHLFEGFQSPLNLMYTLPLDFAASSLAGMADAVVNTHFFVPRAKKVLATRFFGPIIPNAMLGKKPLDGNDIVAYLPNQFFMQFLKSCIKSQLGANVVFFCTPQQMAAAQRIAKKHKKIVLRDINAGRFMDALLSARCFVSHGGISSLTEALFLKKPCYVLTDKYFYERYFNGKAMETLGYGMCRESADAGEFSRFLENHAEYAKALKKKPVVPANKEIVKFINSIIN